MSPPSQLPITVACQSMSSHVWLTVHGKRVDTVAYPWAQPKTFCQQEKQHELHC